MWYNSLREESQKKEAAESYSQRVNMAPEPAQCYAGIECAGRQSGRGVLLDRAARLEREAAGLRALASAIPDNFPGDADEALWELALQRAGSLR